MREVGWNRGEMQANEEKRENYNMQSREEAVEEET